MKKILINFMLVSVLISITTESKSQCGSLSGPGSGATSCTATTFNTSLYNTCSAPALLGNNCFGYYVELLYCATLNGTYTTKSTYNYPSNVSGGGHIDKNFTLPIGDVNYPDGYYKAHAHFTYFYDGINCAGQYCCIDDYTPAYFFTLINANVGPDKDNCLTDPPSASRIGKDATCSGATYNWTPTSGLFSNNHTIPCGTPCTIARPFAFPALTTTYTRKTTCSGVDCYDDVVVTGTSTCRTEGNNFNDNSSEDAKNDIKFQLVPNPTTGSLNAVLENNEEKIISIEIMNLSGSYIRKLNFQNNGFDISDYSDGIYFVKIFTTYGIRFQKVVKNSISK
jgi:hypothetical protein